MPELPEVHTTATILSSLIKGKKIFNVWTDYFSDAYQGKVNIKNKKYFLTFKKNCINRKIKNVWRKAKYVLIELDNDSTIVIHMKMTGHLLYGSYLFNSKTKKWEAGSGGPLQDPFNRFIHLIFDFGDKTHLAFSDMRKFATVYLVKNKKELEEKFKKFGPEPLDDSFTWKTLKEMLQKKPNQKIKTTLMNQELVSGIGNIYSDEILWESKINPEKIVATITDKQYKTLTKNIKNILSKGINFGGDSMSDYRNPYGEPGQFQLHHKVYRRKGEKCNRKTCTGKILRKVINTRSAHYCSVCQKF